MEFFEALYGRHTTRTYTDEPVVRTEWDALLKAAISAPSASNSQPWSFGIIEDTEILDHLSTAVKAYGLESLGANPAFAKYRGLFESKDFHIFYHAPALLLIMTDSESAWAASDCALAAQNVMLAAHASGLGTCWIGFAQLLLNTPEMKTRLGISQNFKVVAPIAVGHPKNVADASPYKPEANDAMPPKGRTAPKVLFKLPKAQ